MTKQITQLPRLDVDIPRSFKSQMPDWVSRIDGDLGKTGKLTLEVKDFLLPGEKSVTGEKLVERTRQMKPAGFTHMIFLHENRHLIPREWVWCRELVFPGTVFRGSGSSSSVAYLKWDFSGCGDQWDHRWLFKNFGPDSKVICLKSRRSRKTS